MERPAKGLWDLCVSQHRLCGTARPGEWKGDLGSADNIGPNLIWIWTKRDLGQTDSIGPNLYPLQMGSGSLEMWTSCERAKSARGAVTWIWIILRSIPFALSRNWIAWKLHLRFCLAAWLHILVELSDQIIYTPESALSWSFHSNFPVSYEESFQHNNVSYKSCIPFAWNREDSDTNLVHSICVGSNIVGVLADCVDVVLVGVVVVIVQVVVHVSHQVEHQQGEGHEVEWIEAIVAFASRATCGNMMEKVPDISIFNNLFPFPPCVAIELVQDNSHSRLLSTIQSGLPLGLRLEAVTERCPSDQLRTFWKPSWSPVQAALQLGPFAGDGVFPGAPPPGGAGPPGPPGSQGDSCPQGGEAASLAWRPNSTFWSES